MRAAFADLPEACDNTLDIAKLCTVMETARKPELPLCPNVRLGAPERESGAQRPRGGWAHPCPPGRAPAGTGEQLGHPSGGDRSKGGT